MHHPLSVLLTSKHLFGDGEGFIPVKWLRKSRHGHKAVVTQECWDTFPSWLPCVASTSSRRKSHSSWHRSVLAKYGKLWRICSGIDTHASDSRRIIWLTRWIYDEGELQFHGELCSAALSFRVLSNLFRLFLRNIGGAANFELGIWVLILGRIFAFLQKKD